MNKKIRWCCKQIERISLIKPDENLSKAYIKETHKLETKNMMDTFWKDE